MDKVSIIIPYKERWDLTHHRMAELRQYAPENVEIVLVNDGSDAEDCREGAIWWKDIG